jgi:hypothetical protein
MKHYVDPTDADLERAMSVDLTRTGEANSEAVDDGNALQGREAANLSAQENCPQPEALQQVASVCGFVPTSGNTPQVEDRGLEPPAFSHENRGLALRAAQKAAHWPRRPVTAWELEAVPTQPMPSINCWPQSNRYLLTCV